VIRQLAELDLLKFDLRFEPLSTGVLKSQLEHLVHKSGDNLWISFRNFYVCYREIKLTQAD
jgi:hypothetical protein